MPDAREIAVAAVQPFIAGMIAGTIATCVTQPVDFLKTQLQLSGEGTRAGLRPSAFQVARSILAAQGIAVFYTGLGAALARQVLYGSARLGLFRVFSDALKARYFAADALPVSLKVGAALAAGAIAALVGNPADLVLVRMQADSALPPEAQRRYRGVFDAVSRIVREEGVLALWRGAAPTVLRAMAMNVGMLATADQAKEAFAPALGGVDSIATLLASSAVAGVTASFASLPFDMVKTRLQKQQPLPDGSLPYRGVVDCAVQIAGKEGPLAFFKGLGTFVLRIGPHSFIALVVLDYVSGAIDAWKAVVFRAAADPANEGPPPSGAGHRNEGEGEFLRGTVVWTVALLALAVAYLIVLSCKRRPRGGGGRGATSATGEDAGPGAAAAKSRGLAAAETEA